MSRRINLSKRHGLNPSIPLCFYCNQPKNEIIIAGRLPGDKEAPRSAVWDQVPCDQCQKYMEQGVIIISVRDGESGNNPYRTGHWLVVTEDYIKRVVTDPEILKDTLDHRSIFMEDTVIAYLGLDKAISQP